jgi:hypothetical protein
LSVGIQDCLGRSVGEAGVRDIPWSSPLPGRAKNERFQR